MSYSFISRYTNYLVRTALQRIARSYPKGYSFSRDPVTGRVRTRIQLPSYPVYTQVVTRGERPAPSLIQTRIRSGALVRKNYKTSPARPVRPYRLASYTQTRLNRRGRIQGSARRSSVGFGYITWKRFGGANLKAFGFRNGFY